MQRITFLSHIDLIRALKDNEIKVYLLMHSLCYKGKSINSPREIKTNGIARTLNLTYKQTRRSIEKLVRLGLFERYTAKFRDNEGLPRCSSFYRISLD